MYYDIKDIGQKMQETTSPTSSHVYTKEEIMARLGGTPVVQTPSGLEKPVGVSDTVPISFKDQTPLSAGYQPNTNNPTATQPSLPTGAIGVPPLPPYTITPLSTPPMPGYAYPQMGVVPSGMPPTQPIENPEAQKQFMEAYLVSQNPLAQYAKRAPVQNFVKLRLPGHEKSTEAELADAETWTKALKEAQQRQETRSMWLDIPKIALSYLDTATWGIPRALAELASGKTGDYTPESVVGTVGVGLASAAGLIWSPGAPLKLGKFATAGKLPNVSPFAVAEAIIPRIPKSTVMTSALLRNIARTMVTLPMATEFAGAGNVIGGETTLPDEARSLGNSAVAGLIFGGLPIIPNQFARAAVGAALMNVASAVQQGKFTTADDFYNAIKDGKISRAQVAAEATNILLDIYFSFKAGNRRMRQGEDPGFTMATARRLMEEAGIGESRAAGLASGALSIDSLPPHKRKAVEKILGSRKKYMSYKNQADIEEQLRNSVTVLNNMMAEADKIATEAGKIKESEVSPEEQAITDLAETTRWWQEKEPTVQTTESPLESYTKVSGEDVEGLFKKEVEDRLAGGSEAIHSKFVDAIMKYGVSESDAIGFLRGDRKVEDLLKTIKYYDFDYSQKADKIEIMKSLKFLGFSARDINVLLDPKVDSDTLEGYLSRIRRTIADLPDAGYDIKAFTDNIVRYHDYMKDPRSTLAKFRDEYNRELELLKKETMLRDMSINKPEPPTQPTQPIEPPKSPVQPPSETEEAGIQNVSQSTQGAEVSLDTKFRELQDLQRGEPESMFQKENVGADFSGKAQWAMEHTGDLIHRASYPKEGSGWGGGGWEYGLEATREKAEKLLKTLETDKDTFFEQAKRNWAYESRKGDTKLTEEEYVKAVTDALGRYANAYEKLPVYTELQKVSRDAAIALGRQDMKAYKEALERVVEITKEGKTGYFRPIAEPTSVEAPTQPTQPEKPPTKEPVQLPISEETPERARLLLELNLPDWTKKKEAKPALDKFIKDGDATDLLNFGIENGFVDPQSTDRFRRDLLEERGRVFNQPPLPPYTMRPEATGGTPSEPPPPPGVPSYDDHISKDYKDKSSAMSDFATSPLSMISPMFASRNKDPEIQEAIIKTCEVSSHCLYDVNMAHLRNLDLLGRVSKADRKNLIRYLQEYYEVMRTTGDIEKFEAKIGTNAYEYVEWVAKFFNLMKVETKKQMAWELRQRMDENESRVFDRVIGGGERVEDAIREVYQTRDKRKLNRLIKNMNSFIEANKKIENWGKKDYIPKFEFGSYFVRDAEGNVLAVGKDINVAEAKARRLIDINPDLDVIITQGDGQGINPFLESKDILAGERDLGDIVDAYARYAFRRLHIGKAAIELRKATKDLDPSVRKYVNMQLRDAMGRYSIIDKWIDSIVIKGIGWGVNPGRTRKAIEFIRAFEANAKLGYRPVASAINLASALVNSLIGTTRLFGEGKKGVYMLDAARFYATQEGQDLIEANEHFLGLQYALDADTGRLSSVPGEGIWKKLKRAVQPLALYQMSEVFPRKLGFLANYLYAKDHPEEISFINYERGPIEPAKFEEACQRFARRGVWVQLFNYNIASVAPILRTNPARVIGQFKNYLMQSCEFFATMNARERGAYLAAQVAIGGPKGLFLVMKSLPLIGWIMGSAGNPMEKYMNQKDEWLGVPRNQWWRGLPGILAGMDISSAAAVQFPQSQKDILGPGISDLYTIGADLLVPVLFKHESHVFNSDPKDLFGTKPDIEKTVIFMRNWSLLWDVIGEKSGNISPKTRTEYIEDWKDLTKIFLGGKPVDRASVEDINRMQDMETSVFREISGRILDQRNRGVNIPVEELVEHGIAPSSIKKSFEGSQRGRILQNVITAPIPLKAKFLKEMEDFVPKEEKKK